MKETFMRETVAGFLFSESKRHVVLIKKKRPEWQRNLINAVGGKIEDGETELQAMVREFREETGVTFEDWQKFCELKGNDFKVNFFVGFGDLSKVKTVTDEEVVVYKLTQLPKNIICNLDWLIPMALGFIKNVTPVYSISETSEHISVCDY